MIVTLEDNALVADIKRALKLIRGVASDAQRCLTPV